jgi:hypothetical protein
MQLQVPFAGGPADWDGSQTLFLFPGAHLCEASWWQLILAKEELMGWRWSCLGFSRGSSLYGGARHALEENRGPGAAREWSGLPATEALACCIGRISNERMASMLPSSLRACRREAVSGWVSSSLVTSPRTLQQRAACRRASLWLSVVSDLCAGLHSSLTCSLLVGGERRSDLAQCGEKDAR